MFEIVTLLIVLAAGFGALNHVTLRLPSGVALTIAGLLASLFILSVDALVPGWGLADELRELVLEDIDFTEALMHGMLSFLLFAGALHTDLRKLTTWFRPIATLATVGVLISTALIGLGASLVFGALGLEVPLLWCFVFGALVSPTDPVAVLGIMRAAGAPKSVEIKVVGESLFNDGVGVVVFTVLLAIASGGGGDHGHGEAITAEGVLLLIGVEVVGGILLGLIAGFLTERLLRVIDEPNLEVLITFALVMGVSSLAFALHSSAPLACVVAGLLIGNPGRDGAMSEDTQTTLDRVWEFVDEALNAVLFLLVGLEVVAFEFSTAALVAAALMIAINLGARAVSVLVPLAVWSRFMDFAPGTRPILIWGGIKGGISVALALSLPPFEGREVVLTATYAIVLFSVLVQGLTVGPLISALDAKDDATPASPEVG
ncbi:MAG: sodium:proton antiporter [Myxococcota bacterium]